MSKETHSDTQKNEAVVRKLIMFTIAMVILPIGSYFASIDNLFHGNATYSGILAAVLANVILIAYIYTAFAEDSLSNSSTSTSTSMSTSTGTVQRQPSKQEPKKRTKGD